MKNTKHTPGPWEVLYEAGTFDSSFGVGMGSYLKDPHCYYTHHIWSSEHDSEMPDEDASDNEVAQYEECLANARLIAAAPELLEALSNIIEHFDLKEKSVVHSPGAGFSVGKAKTAIAKATGEAA